MRELLRAGTGRLAGVGAGQLPDTVVGFGRTPADAEASAIVDVSLIASCER